MAAAKSVTAVDFDTLRLRVAADINQLFHDFIPVSAGPEGRLHDAMRHAATSGGKRLRALLVVTSADLFNVPYDSAIRAGLAVECVHAHSLVHDDLPCMDNDDLRRGLPTVHRAFDEATAVLAGDALLALSFEVLTEPELHPDSKVQASLVRTLASASGGLGMAGGQMIDLRADGLALDLQGVERMQSLKTGALISWCVEAGSILGGANDEDRSLLLAYARCVGLAFQIADDLLDASGCEKLAGKRLRKDSAAGKGSIVALLGEARAQSYAQDLTREAKHHVCKFGSRSFPLEAIADFAITRSC